MIELPWSFATGEQLYIVTMCTEAGNILVVKTSTINDALNALLSGYVIKGEHISPTGTYGHPYDPYYTWLVTDVDNENDEIKERIHDTNKIYYNDGMSFFSCLDCTAEIDGRYL